MAEHCRSARRRLIAELWTAVFLVLPLVILLFPDGRLPSRWRVVLWAYLADCALITAIFVAGAAWQVSRAPIVVDAKGQLVHNPGPNDVPLIVFIVLFGAVPVLWVLFVLRQVLSWRRASGERRAQLKWLMAGSAATVIGLAAGAVLGTPNTLLTVLDTICLVVGIFSLPVGAAQEHRAAGVDRAASAAGSERNSPGRTQRAPGSWAMK